MNSLWEHLDSAPATKPPLTVERISLAAVAIADQEGLDSVTMRGVASHLGVAPMSLYRHVASKNDVLELMVDFVYGEVFIAQELGWRETLKELAVGIRALLWNHAWLASISLPQAVYELTPNRVALFERVLVVLNTLGVDADTVESIYRTVDSYAQGSSRAEAGMREFMRERGWVDAAEMRAGLGTHLKWLIGAERYPEFEAHLSQRQRTDDAEWQFESGLSLVLDGIAGRVGESAAATSPPR